MPSLNPYEGLEAALGAALREGRLLSGLYLFLDPEGGHALRASAALIEPATQHRFHANGGTLAEAIDNAARKPHWREAETPKSASPTTQRTLKKRPSYDTSSLLDLELDL